MVPIPDQLRDLLVEVITGAAGGDAKRWRLVVGQVRKLSLAFHPVSNWAVTPGGTAEEKAIVTRAVEIVRAEHPYVAG